MTSRSSSKPQNPSVIIVTIEKLIPGGNGLARHDGKVVFIPEVLPGEKIRAKIVEEKKDFIRAECIEILEASAERIEPPCVVAHRCGGCDWQHITYQEQLKQKIAMTKDALKRTGGILFPDLNIVPSKPFGYRNRIQYHLSEKGAAGFLAKGSHDIVEVQNCLVAHPTFQSIFNKPHPPASPATPANARFAAWAHTLKNKTENISLQQSLNNEESFLINNDIETAFSVPILNRELFFDLRCFFQSNLEMVEKLIPYMLENLSSTPSASTKNNLALDLYCGVGLFGAFLKDYFQKILAVEENVVALNYAKKNIDGQNSSHNSSQNESKNGNQIISGTHIFLAGKLEDLIAQGNSELINAKPDLILVDPPRPGLDENVRQYLINQKPERLIYVSCNPVTLARDLKILLAQGFQLDDLKLFDFYPQTAHVEAVAKLSYPQKGLSESKL